MRQLFVEKILQIPTSMLFGVERIKFLNNLSFAISVHIGKGVSLILSTANLGTVRGGLFTKYH